MGLTVTSAVRWWAREMPEAIAIDADGRAVTYLALNDWSLGIAERLAKLGVQPGDRVGISATNSLEYCALILGVFQAGAIAAPISFRSTESELRLMGEKLGLKLMFADAARIGAARQVFADRMVVAPLEDLSEIRAASGEAAAPPPVPDDAPALLTATSGSTGSPKYAVYSQRGPAIFACELALTEPGCARGARSLNIAPFASGGVLVLLKFLTLGHTQFVRSAFDPQSVLELIVRERINVMQIVPVFYERMSELPEFAGADLSSLRFTTVGGAPVREKLLQTWQAKGVTLRQLYGQTEAGGAWEARETALTAPEKCGRGSIFTEFAVDSAAAGEAGEILVRGPTAMLGYWRDPEATARTLADGWVHTGDLGTIDGDGNITFVDRLKDIIISGGMNISAAEVERVIMEIDGVIEVAVIGVADARFGETPLAVIHAARPLDIAAVIRHCDLQLSNYKVPRYVVLSDEPLPRLPAGKISKPELRTRHRDAPQQLAKVR